MNTNDLLVILILLALGGLALYSCLRRKNRGCGGCGGGSCGGCGHDCGGGCCGHCSHEQQKGGGKPQD